MRLTVEGNAWTKHHVLITPDISCVNDADLVHHIHTAIDMGGESVIESALQLTALVPAF